MISGLSLLHGKRGIILGVANVKSIAYSIYNILQECGAEKIVLTYPSEVIKKRIDSIVDEFENLYSCFCDVADQESISCLFKYANTVLDGKIDFIVHSVAFSDKDELRGAYYKTSLSNFLNAMNISCYSLTAIAREASIYMKESGGSILTMTYYGAEKVIPHYNVMGICKAALEASVKYLAVDLGEFNIRVNALSAGPIKTLAATGIGDFSYIMDWCGRNAPLKSNVTLEDIAKSALYLLSDLSSGVTGEVLHVDNGFHVIGMPKNQ